MINFLKKNYVFLGILLFSVILRVVSSIFMGDQVTDMPGTFDQISYHNLALRVLSGHGFSFGELWWPITPADAPTAHWSFLYTLYLVLVYGVFGPHPLVARLIQAVITGILQPYLAYQMGSLLFSKKVGLISATLTAVYAYFIYYDASLMTEPFFLVAVMGSIYLSILLSNAFLEPDQSHNHHPIKLTVSLGVTLGVAVLLRQLFLIFIPFLFIWIWWRVKGSQKITRIMIRLGTSSIIVILMILPFTIYNTARFGHMVLLNTNSGYAFFWANHPIYGTQFIPILPKELGTYQSLIPVSLRNLDEAELDQALLRQGLTYVMDDPIRYVLLSLSRIPSYFMFWPSSDSGLVSNISRVASFGIMWPFMLFGAVKSLFEIRKKKFRDFLSSPSVLFVLFAIIYSLIHLLSWALIRYRLPVDAIMIVFAGSAIYELILWVKSWKKVVVQP